MEKGDNCLVTGVSGYIGSWIAKELLQQGYKVRGTVRNADDGRIVDVLPRLLPGIQLISGDLRGEQGWQEAMSGIRWVFHVASPQASSYESDRVRTATLGTSHVLKAAFAEPTVEKIVLTSSETAMCFGHPRAKERFSEDDWSVLKGSVGRFDYIRSKTMAEKLAWEFASDPSLNRREIALVSILPAFVLGPSLVPWRRHSMELLYRFATGRIPICPRWWMHFVDVRDCARMHVALMQDPNANFRRHLSFSTFGWMSDLASFVQSTVPEARSRTRVAPSALFWLLKFARPEVGAIFPLLDKKYSYIPNRPEAYKPVHDDLTEMVASSISSMAFHGMLS
jgi:dihydroflavonol-4-reductase